jgi:hypothetical protein
MTIHAFAELLDDPRWLAWREEERGGRKTKIPYTVHGRGFGSATDTATWGTHAEAAGRARGLQNGSNANAGCGIVLGDLGGDFFLVGADLDSSIDANNALAPWAVSIISALSSYSEISPSGRGLKAFFLIGADDVRWFLDRLGVEADKWGTKRGIPGLSGADHGPGIELYCSGRYFTVTGRLWSTDQPHIEVLDRGRLEALAALIPPPASAGGQAAGNAHDTSRSARAMRAALALGAGSFEGMRDGLRNHSDPEISAWVREKGEASGGRELRRIWNKISSDDDEDAGWAAPPAEEPWPEMDAEAFYGLAGAVVEAIVPTTEADPVAILVHFLHEVGNAIGRKPYYQHEHTRHYPNLFAVMLGRTGKSRKGTSANRVGQVMEIADAQWANNCIKGGLSSGEGLIAQIHDEIRGREKIRRNKQIEYVDVVKDPGVADKRLMVIETEFAGALGALRREGNILSRVMRDAYDGRTLATLTKNNPMKATGGHISVIAHVTVDEYRRLVDQTSLSNGFCNRFLHVLVRRSQELPFGSALDEETASHLAQSTREVIEMAQNWSRIDFTDEAKDLWVAGYHDLSSEKPGLFGDIVARSEAHTIRLALIYALLDRRRQIYAEHLRAALAFWGYCEASAKYIFRDYLGDPLADEILIALRQAGASGMTRVDLSNFFGRNQSSERIGRALALLAKAEKVRASRRDSSSGRPAEIWKAV